MALYADYSAGTIPGAKLKAAGFTGAVRYITAPNLMNPAGHNQKHMTLAEYRDHKANGLDTVFVMQGNTGDADTGRAGGSANARLALAGLQYLGAPADTPVFFTNDRPELPNPATWQEYIRGAQSVLGHAGAYGFRNAIDAVWTVATWFWQCGSEKALRPGVHLYQQNYGQVTVGGILCDVNKVLVPVLEDDELSAADAWNGVAGLLKAVESGDAPDIRKALVDVVAEGAFNGFASAVKAIGSGDADDLKLVLTGLVGKTAEVELTDAQIKTLTDQFGPVTQEAMRKFYENASKPVA